MIKAGLIGEKLPHSISPQIHEAYGTLTGQDIRYVLHETNAAGLSALLARLKSEGYAGVNVTIPHKKAVMPLLDEVSPEALAIGAVNTVWFSQGKSVGYNSDYFGLQSLLERNDIGLRGQTVAILGSGGAARCAHALAQDLNAARVITVSRDPGKVEPELNAAGYETLDAMDEIGVLVNATPSGMYPRIDGCPAGDGIIQKTGAVIDLIYNPPETALLQKASALGKRCAGGLWMLCAQAAKAEEIWTGVPYSDEICACLFNSMAEVMRTNIVLIGMPGCGKTEIGRRLAQRLDMAMLDTDAFVEAEHGVIKEIFASLGEAAFRDMELSAAQCAARRAHSVISTGGGIVQTKAAMHSLKASGIIVYIDRPLSLLLNETETMHRPLLAGGREALAVLYEKRRVLYEGYADIRVVNDAGSGDCVEAIITKLEERKK